MSQVQTIEAYQSRVLTTRDLLNRHRLTADWRRTAPDSTFNQSCDDEFDARMALKNHVIAALGINPHELPFLAEALS